MYQEDNALKLVAILQVVWTFPKIHQKVYQKNDLSIVLLFSRKQCVAYYIRKLVPPHRSNFIIFNDMVVHQGLFCSIYHNPICSYFTVISLTQKKNLCYWNSISLWPLIHVVYVSFKNRSLFNSIIFYRVHDLFVFG